MIQLKPKYAVKSREGVFKIYFFVCVVILQSHKPHIIALDAVLDEEASQRDVYDSTTKVQRMLLAIVFAFYTSA